MVTSLLTISINKASALGSGEKNLCDNVPVRFNDWHNAGAPPKDTVPKSALVKFSVLTHNHGIGGVGKFGGQSFGARLSLQLNQIEDAPKATIEVWQSIFNELLSSMFDVSPLTAVELFQRRMKEEGLAPDIQTYSSVISACEAGGQWQRALGILRLMTSDDSIENPNKYCYNAAIAACEKGGAWLEAVELYERMRDQVEPNFITMNS